MSGKDCDWEVLQVYKVSAAIVIGSKAGEGGASE